LYQFAFNKVEDKEPIYYCENPKTKDVQLAVAQTSLQQGNNRLPPSYGGYDAGTDKISGANSDVAPSFFSSAVADHTATRTATRTQPKQKWECPKQYVLKAGRLFDYKLGFTPNSTTGKMKSVDEVYLYGEKKRRNYEIIEKGVDKFKFSVTLVCEKTEKGWIINSGTIQKGEGLQRDSLGVAITVGTSAEAGVVFAKASVNASIQGSYNHSWETYRFGEEQDIQKYSKDVIGKPCK